MAKNFLICFAFENYMKWLFGVQVQHTEGHPGVSTEPHITVPKNLAKNICGMMTAEEIKMTYQR